eukprot:scaffold182697_cov28-Prasinocladus_malaysianus.AAC.1
MAHQPPDSQGSKGDVTTQRQRSKDDEVPVRHHRSRSFSQSLAYSEEFDEMAGEGEDDAGGSFANLMDAGDIQSMLIDAGRRHEPTEPDAAITQVPLLPC